MMTEKENSHRRQAQTDQTDTDSTQPIDRRTVLKSMSAGIAATTGLSAVGISSASTAVTDEYDAADIHQLLANHKDLLTVLANREILTSSSITALSIDSLSPPSPNDPIGERVVQLTVDGKRWTELRIFRQTDRGGLAIVVLIEDDEAYATLNPHDSGPLVTIQVDGTMTHSDPTTTEYPSREACMLPCPTNDPCCRCVEVCKSGCNCSCTPVYIWECQCCNAWPPKCAINCA